MLDWPVSLNQNLIKCLKVNREIQTENYSHIRIEFHWLANNLFMALLSTQLTKSELANYHQHELR